MIVLSDRDFRSEIKAAGCTVDDRKAPHRVDILYKGMFVSSYSVTHGKNTKGGEVKLPYIKNFRKTLPLVKAKIEQEAPDA